MDLSGIISISGRPGLYKVIAQGKNSIIVESLIDKKRFPAYSTDRISALEDISIYTHEDDKPLKEILEGLYKKVEGKECPSHKEDLNTLEQYLSDVLPDYDKERVYPSDIKKLFQWYNILFKAGVLIPEEKTEEKAEKKVKKETKPAADKKPAAKKAPAGKKATGKSATTSGAKNKVVEKKGTTKK